MSIEVEVARLQEQSKAILKDLADERVEIEKLKADLRDMQDRNSKRVWAGLLAVGTVTLAAFGTIGSLVVYIFKREVG